MEGVTKFEIVMLFFLLLHALHIITSSLAVKQMHKDLEKIDRHMAQLTAYRI